MDFYFSTTKKLIFWIIAIMFGCSLGNVLRMRNPIMGMSVKAFTMLPTTSTINARTRTNGRAGVVLFSSSNLQEEIKSMRVSEIKRELESYGINTRMFLEKSELVEALAKIRQEGIKEKAASSNTETTQSQQQQQQPGETTTTSSSLSREERLQQEMAICRTMRAIELKRELTARGVDIRALFEKSELVRALAEARVDGKQVKASSTDSSNNNNYKRNSNGEGYAEYNNVEVLTDDASGPQKRSQQQQQQSPFGGMGGGGGANPFGGGMGSFTDLFGKMGGGMGSPFGGFANPFASGSSGGGANTANNNQKTAGGAGAGGRPGGGMPDMKMAQELLKNPKIRDLMMKAQSNPRVMKIMQECVTNPSALSKYKDDPDLKEMIAELRKAMGM